MASSPPKAAATILVVDDDREVLSLAVDLLRSAGYTVLGTADPSQALQLARNHAQPLDLLLSDVVMPLKSGLQLASEVRALRPEVKVLLMSAYRTQALSGQALHSCGARADGPGRAGLPQTDTVARVANDHAINGCAMWAPVFTHSSSFHSACLACGRRL